MKAVHFFPVLAVCGLITLARPGFAQQAEKTETPAGLPAPPKTPINQEPKSPPQLKPMFLDKKVFTPDDRWHYEEADDDRAFGSSVEQVTGISFGSPQEPSHGAFVKYYVFTLASPEKAHGMYLKLLPKNPVPANVKRTTRGWAKADEGSEITEALLDPKGVAQQQDRIAVARYGRYVVQLLGNSDMRAPGPRPQTGERKWLSEPVFENTLQALKTRWANYKTLLAAYK